jgi:hypothetical protein
MLSALRRTFQVFLAMVFLTAGYVLGGYAEGVLWMMAGGAFLLAIG